jgi:hypothetical protein
MHAVHFNKIVKRSSEYSRHIQNTDDVISFSVACKLRRRYDDRCAPLALGATVCVHQFACSMSFPVHIHKADGTTSFVVAACFIDKQTP